MKRFTACLLVLGSIAVLTGGCNPKEEKKAAEAATEKAAEHPAPAAPMDHPAH